MNFGSLLCAVVVLAACSCTSGEQPQLIVPGLSGSFGVTMPDTTAGRPYTFTAIPVCLDAPGRVEVIGAEVDNAHGRLVVSRVGVAPWEQRFPGNAYATLPQIGYPPGRQVVDTACRSHDDGRSQYELGLEFRRHGPGTGYGDAVDVQYRFEGRTKTLRLPFSVTCARSATPQRATATPIHHQTRIRTGDRATHR